MNINIVSTYTADVLRTELEQYLNKFCEADVRFFYNQLFQQTLFHNSELNTNQQGLNVILFRLSDYYSYQDEASETQAKQENLLLALRTFNQQMKVPLLFIITPSHREAEQEKSWFQTLEITLIANIKTLQHTTVIGSDDLNATENQNIYNPFTEKHGHIPYNMDFYHALAKKIARSYSLLSRKPFKVIVLDCDGTLWNGIIEEQGLSGIDIDSHDQALQQFMIDCHKRGLLLCLCSKNSEGSVLEVFNHRPEMRLQLHRHICTHRINWLAKSDNIKDIAQELNLGLDSFIFIDDNPVECAEVKAAIPEILAIELPKDKTERCVYLRNIWAFDTPDKQHEETSRTIFYQTNRLRNQLKSQSVSYADFLKQLQIKTHISQATEHDFDRINELSLRTNQFNIYPRAMTGIELHQAIIAGHPNVLKIEVRDKFMEYGLVGVLVYEQTDTLLRVQSLFLSCRILSRGIEHEIVKHLIKLAEQHGLETIVFKFTRTERNTPALNFLKQLNRQQALSGDELSLSIQSIKNYSPIIEEEQQKSKKQPNPVVQSIISHDYMLDVAHSSLTQQNQASDPKRSKTNNASAIHIHLQELFLTHHLKINQNDIPLIYFGLTSLHSVLIASEIYSTYGVEINPVQLLSGQVTLDNLIGEVITTLKQTTDAPASLIHEHTNQWPLSRTQKRLWYDEHLIDNKSSRNTMFIAFQFNAPINKNALNKAMASLIEQHDVLRCFFINPEDPHVCIVPLNEFSLNIEYVLCKDAEECNAFASQLKYHHFALDSAPLFRMAVINPDSERPQLLLSIHHIIHDGWSLNKLMKDLSLYYNFYSASNLIKMPSIHPAGSSYSHYSLWEQAYYTETLQQKNTLFWSHYLHKLPKLELIYDHPEQESIHASPCARLSFKLNQSVSKRLKQWSRTYHVTLFELLATAFGLLLSQLARQEDIHFVTATSGRHHPRTTETIGFFVNLLILRISVNPSLPFIELVKEFKKNIARVMAHQELSFHELLEEAGETTGSKSTVFHQAGFIYQSYPTHHLVLNGSSGTRIHTEDKAALLYDACQECRFGNLVCFMQEFDDQIHGLFEYNAILFEKETIKHYVETFQTILKHITNDPLCVTAAIPLLSSRQKTLLTQRWNREIMTYEPHVNLLSHFTKIVNQYPNKIAVVQDKHKITYLELDQQSELLAKRLINEGVTFEAPVALYLEQGTLQITAILAVLKAGGCYIPLDTDLPSQRMNYILQDAHVALLLVDGHTKEHLTTYARENLNMMNISELSTVNDDSWPKISSKIHPNQLAYILYTSGSTGTPKGVMIEHSGILRLVCETNYIQIKHHDRIAQASKFLFDASTLEIWGALLNGATLVCLAQSMLLNKEELNAFLKKERISILFLTTQLFHTYAHLTPELFTNRLRYLVVGGEALLADSVQRVMNQAHPPHCLINGYGPTENTTFSTTYSIKNKWPIPNPIPIGKPIKGTRAFVLNQALQLAPIGAIGTLYLSGQGLARAYLHQDSLTAERFIHLFGERLYNTGDLVVWQSDGNLRYIGREDHQIKINGFRIELNEIEAQLNAHPFVEQGIVLIKHQEHHRYLAAYLLLKEQKPMNDLNIVHHLKHTLPQYMIPHFFYQVDHIPMTTNGKVDRKQLEHLDLDPMSDCPFESPQTPIEQQLAFIYAQVLNLEHQDISIHAEFFDIGGNSISALQLIHHLNTAFQINLTFSILYEQSSIKVLGRYIEGLIKCATPVYDNKSSLKQIKKGSSKKKPLIFVHPIGGTGFCYLDLIKHLPDDQPCYLIQDPSIEANEILFKNMHAMATHYNQLLISHFGETPFVLAGYSFGGMLSIEMASQLGHLEHLVSGIMTFDTWIVSRFLNKNAKEALKQSIMKQYQQIEENLLKERIEPKPWMELYYVRLQELGFSYIPPKIHTKIILFKAQEMADEFSAMHDPFNFLHHHSHQPIEIHPVDGTHNTILQQPNVQQIASVVAQHPMLGKNHE